MANEQTGEFVSYEGEFVERPVQPPIFGFRIWLRTLQPGREDGMLPTIPEKFDGAIFQVLRLGNNEQEICGSGFFIAPGLALTATHVFDGHEKGDRFRAISPRSDGTLEQWTIEQFHAHSKEKENVMSGGVDSRRFDIALVSLRPSFALPSMLDINLIELEIEVPQIGDLVTVVGYRAPTVEVVGERHIRSQFQMLSSVGRVTDLFPEGRDWNLPNPAFAAALETPGGVSGGAVFNAKGRAIGVLSASFGDKEIGYSSTLSLIWPAFRSSVAASWPPDWPNERANILTAVQAGRAGVVGGEIAQSDDGQGRFILPDEGS